MRGRTLAASVVVTFSLAELIAAGGCDSAGKGGDEHGTRNPPPTTDAKAPEPKPTRQAAPETAPHEAKHKNPPPPEDAKTPDAKTPDAKTPDTAAEPKPEEKDPFPFPDNTIRSDEKTVMLQADGTCVETKEVKCKPGKHCNPPKPKAIKCPKELRLPRAKGAAEIYTLGNQTCWQRGVSKCAEGETCDPPPSTRVVCPKK